MNKLILFTVFVTLIIDIHLLLVASAHYLYKASSSNDLFSAAESQATLEKYSPEIVNELRDFVNLIPAATVDEIAAKHYIVDGGFRKAMKFLRSGEFKQLVQHVQELPSVIEILRYVHLLVDNNIMVVTTDSPVVNFDKQLEDLLLKEDLQAPLQTFYVIVDANPNNTEAPIPSGGNIKTFTSFVYELLEHLPRSRYVDMINEKRQRSAAFEQFYRALRSDQLKTMVDSALTSSDLSSTIATLKSNDIDGPGLVKIAFNVISWGPNTSDEISVRSKPRNRVHRTH